MKKGGLIHPELLAAIGSLGHKDEFFVCDAGMPIPSGIQRIDLAYRPGCPPFLDVLRAVIAEVVVARAFVAQEAAAGLVEEIEAVVDCPVERVPHDILKERTGACRFAIRTGEFTPYANVVLVAGVAF
jgi:D-ribose pyranase